MHHRTGAVYTLFSPATSPGVFIFWSVSFLQSSSPPQFVFVLAWLACACHALRILVPTKDQAYARNHHWRLQILE